MKGSPRYRPLPRNPSRIPRYGRRSALPWVQLGPFLLWSGIGLLMGLRLRSLGCLPESYAQWWRSAYAMQGAERLDPAQGLYPAQLPFYNWLGQGALRLPGIPSLAWMQLLAILACLLVLLLCWSRGNLWSAGLWGLSPWAIQLGPEPNSEVLGGLLLLLAGLTPGRFLWLGLACIITAKAWPMAIFLAALWASQERSRRRLHRFRGLYIVAAAIGLTLLWQRGLPWPNNGIPIQTWQAGLSVIAPLMLPLGLTLVRLAWPWMLRQQALIGLAALGHVLVGLALVLLTGLSPEESARFGLVVLPLLCWIAGGVLAEIGELGWRRILGGLLLVSSLLLALQSLQQLPQQTAALAPARTAARWLRAHRDQIRTPVIVDSAVVAYYSQLPVQQLLSSPAARYWHGDPIPENVDWLVINQAEPLAWRRSLLVQKHPEFTFQSRARLRQNNQQVSYWELVFAEQVTLPSANEFLRPLDLSATDRPIVRIWRRVRAR